MAHADDTLEVLLHGESVGVLTKGKKHGSATFRYHPDASYALSVSMPVRESPYDPVATRNWFTGLLPEGERSSFLAKYFVVSLTDYVDLLRETGLECAGAVSFRKPLAVPASVTTDFAEVLSSLPRVHDNADPDSLRSIVAGFQPKVTASYRGGLNLSGSSFLTTHIVKPEPERWAGMADAEAWAMTLASASTKTAEVSVEDFGGTRALIVTRFDRLEYDGEVLPIHQEDFCQALGLGIERKYAEPGVNLKTSPSLGRLAALLKKHALDPERELEELARHLTVNVLLGNLDWHAKNVGLLHDTDGHVSLAPLYDLVPVTSFPLKDKKMSMSVNKKFHVDRIRFDDLVHEVTSWGVDSDRGESIIRATMDSVANGIPDADKKYPLRPDNAVILLSSKLELFSETKEDD